MKEILPPTCCPECSSKLVLVNMQLFCENSDCPAKQGKQIEHYAKKMKIKGLAEKTIEKLNITSVIELYALTLEEIISKLNSEALGVKLFNEIEKSKETDFATFLSALGIPLIGDTASRKLAKVVSSIDDITVFTAKGAGLGDVATSNLLDWIANNWKSTYKYLPVSVKPTDSTENKELIEVCITGALKDFKNRSEAANYLAGFGYLVKDSVTKNVKFLICEDASKLGSSSYKKAKEKMIPILTINELIEDK